MKMFTTAGNLDWGGWFRGITGAFISGGAAGVGAAAAVTAFDPSHDIVGVTLLKVVGLTFVISGVVSLMKFLQTHPVPDAKASASTSPTA